MASRRSVSLCRPCYWLVAAEAEAHQPKLLHHLQPRRNPLPWRQRPEMALREHRLECRCQEECPVLVACLGRVACLDRVACLGRVVRLARVQWKDRRESQRVRVEANLVQLRVAMATTVARESPQG
jgi:hypothetical protein